MVARVPPGTLLNPADLVVGQEVQAKDADGFWHNARVIKTGLGGGTSTYVQVHERFRDGRHHL